jgi:hypothetical protein
MIGKHLRAALRADLGLVLHILAAAGDQHQRNRTHKEDYAPRRTEG